MTKKYHNQIFYQSSTQMSQLPDQSIDLIITSPPYFTLKNYSQIEGNKQTIRENGKIVFVKVKGEKITDSLQEDVGNIPNYQEYLKQLTKIWQECERVLKPAGKLCINVPFRNSHKGKAYSISFDVQKEILTQTNLNYYDRFVWDKSNRVFMYQKGTYPYPGNINSWVLKSEDILVFVKPGEKQKKVCEKSLITKQEFQQWIKPVWIISTKPIKEKIHTAPFPLELPQRLIKLYSFVGDTILDPFAGAGTTLLAAQQLNRHFVGYELYQHYQPLIQQRLGISI